MPPQSHPASAADIANEDKQAHENHDKHVDQPLNYVNIFFITLGHVLFVYYCVTFPWIQKFYLVLYTAANMHFTGLGVTAGAHRYFTHRSYKAKLPLKVLLLIAYASCGHNKLYDWVRDHRTHHKFVETDADPHNSNRGFFFSHVGWLFMKKHPEVVAKGKTMNMSDISGDPLLVWYDRHYILMKTIFCFTIPTLIPYYLLNEDLYTCMYTQCIMRYIILLNITWSVNSFAHMYGNKPYNKHENSKENLAVSIATIGEGWHNYHHAFPWDYRASEHGKVNFTTNWLDLCGRLGLAYDFRAATESMIRKVVLKTGDGSHKNFACFAEDEKDI
ncbi:acyl-coa desaturase [Holotrichia oblita]|uniref:Acyl-coa desaturase n=1 Tax=Holotrichia oblita TaxID=644536 RepID=A0ACB9T012_HOLOL|nr:acyl-coa desaturase [Holotrichia oblita]